MRIYNETLSDVTRYLDRYKDFDLEAKEQEFRANIKHMSKFRKIGPETRILEIGTGVGWFPILCKMRGLKCKGLEISPQLVEYGHELGRRHGAEPDIELGNIEDTDLGEGQYDVIMAYSVFEHVEEWEKGLKRVYDTLAPGGIIYFVSTNKFCPRSGEYPLPFYSWLPNFLRYRLRIALQGPDIMKLGIDFNQFTHPLLRRTFRRLGFTEVHDWFDVVGKDLTIPKPWKKALVSIILSCPPLRAVALTFMRTTMFVCVK